MVTVLRHSIATTMVASETPDSVRDFYNGSVILITGGTGFIGKVLIEKLLRVYQIKKIYVIIRSKNDMDCETRLAEFFKESIFDRLHSENPDAFKKVFPIEACFAANDLNVSEANKNIIWNEVEIVFNIVASVKFNERFRDAVEINVLGTKKILDLVMETKHLKTLLHVSTLYSNCDKKFIAEKVYEQEIAYEKIMELTRSLDDIELNKMQDNLVGKMPNTYTMTKRCSEDLVNHRAHCLPAGIFRPPIVLSTYKEPVAGWTDNLYGPSGIITSVARGFVHVIYGSANKKANLVPADFCVSAMIASAWDISKRYHSRIYDQTEIPVYNYIYDKNNLTWGKYMKLVQYGLHGPLSHALWYFSYGIVSSKIGFTIINAFVHILPGYLLDAFAYCTGRKLIYRSIYRKLCRLIKMMSYFGLREWKFENTNIQKVSGNLQAKDRTDLQFNMDNIDWIEYFHDYLPGIKKYFFKETLGEDVRRSRVRTMHSCLKYTFWAFLTSSSFLTIWKLLTKYLCL